MVMDEHATALHLVRTQDVIAGFRPEPDDFQSTANFSYP